MAKIKKKLILTIDCQFGSEFQKESSLDSLALMIKSWVQFYEATNKQNVIKFAVKEDMK